MEGYSERPEVPAAVCFVRRDFPLGQAGEGFGTGSCWTAKPHPEVTQTNFFHLEHSCNMSSIVTSSVWAGGCPATMLARLVLTLDPAQHPLPPALPVEQLIVSPLGTAKISSASQGCGRALCFPHGNSITNFRPVYTPPAPSGTPVLSHFLSMPWLRGHVSCSGGSKEAVGGKQAP